MSKELKKAVEKDERSYEDKLRYMADLLLLKCEELIENTTTSEWVEGTVTTVAPGDGYVSSSAPVLAALTQMERLSDNFRGAIRRKQQQEQRDARPNGAGVAAYNPDRMIL